MVFCVFAGCVLLVIMLGGSTYASMNEIAAEGRDERVLLSYVRTKIRSTDSAGAISVGYFNGASALFIEENFDGHEFITRIYLYDGWVRELFHHKDNELLPGDGAAVCVWILATAPYRAERGSQLPGDEREDTRRFLSTKTGGCIRAVMRRFFGFLLTWATMAIFL